MVANFEWDEKKNHENQEKHGVGFEEAQRAFQDPYRLIIQDSLHSETEDRWFCVGDIGTGIVTVRFTMRASTIRIFGAGYWRKMRGLYYRQKGQP
ncbi:MAG: BrnT family toxin [Caldilineaceae bacterium]|nr:BrnT family toxin [Caldilineaceae bacterium]